MCSGTTYYIAQKALSHTEVPSSSSGNPLWHQNSSKMAKTPKFSLSRHNSSVLWGQIKKSGRVNPSGLTQRSFLPSFIQIRQRLGQVMQRKLTNSGEPPAESGSLRDTEGGFAPRGRSLRDPSSSSPQTPLKKGTTSLRSVVN